MSVSKPTLLDNALQSIINELAKGTAPWRKPWKTVRPSLPLRSTGEAFSGMNAILLSTIQMAHGYASPYWLTYNQAVAQGASVRRGERGSPAILYKVKVVDGGEGAGGSDGSEGGEGDGDRVLRFLKSYAVFNAAQIDGLPDIFYPEAAASGERSFEPLSPAVVSIIAHFPAPVVVGGDRACYVPAADRIHMPQRISFESDADYVATLFHEYT
ncbi:ArdC-like ssDNA-binding domain-containing protein, partial [Asticcacaulis sp. W401b]|uniref:ArdC-like ssDNA-binding domain-containing protein n=1 Tax=Asticcacaulis sp. W401b TaxID=3388666 RepID=UPI0039708A40